MKGNSDTTCGSPRVGRGGAGAAADGWCTGSGACFLRGIGACCIDNKASAGSKLGRLGTGALSKEGSKPPNALPEFLRGMEDLSKGGRFFGGGLPPTEGRRGMAMFMLGGGPCGGGFFFLGIAISIGGGGFCGA